MHGKSGEHQSWRVRRRSQSSLPSAEFGSPVDSLSLLPCSRACGCKHFCGRKIQDNLTSPSWASHLVSKWSSFRMTHYPCRIPPVSLRMLQEFANVNCVLYTFGREIQVQSGGSSERRTESHWAPGEGLLEQPQGVWRLYDKYSGFFGRYTYFLLLTGSEAMQDTESTGSWIQHLFLSFLFCLLFSPLSLFFFFSSA